MLLAIDTATRVISLALHDGDRVLAEASWETANHHTVELAPAVQGMLGRAGLTPARLKAVAVALGPGSFTGLRIGLGLAKGLATACQIPLIGVPTLEILAAAQPRFDGELVAVLEVGRGRICVQRFSWAVNAWEPLEEPAIMDWEALLGQLGQTPALLSGEINAAAVQKVVAAAAGGQALTLAPAAARLRRAAYLADRAWQRLWRNEIDNPDTLVPIYLHQPGVPHP
ncbi:MAG: tRNA (adenosine(37)-N6)-threonylcarbamoyltransferase complex dimerization subunit type 1 TsaB [Anaerolineae bacterium]|nr:tRNA (adenosine(37)-N6)-threonylcarbamoyltransferase complex dimerization subunit type 1 TsaB [Anaerolineae bacterium]